MFQNYFHNQIQIKDINNIDLDSVFLHYTNVCNLENILNTGLEPRIGINSKGIEKSEKVFFSVGDKGALVIMDVWLRWLIIKPKSNFIYWIGAYLLNIPLCPKFLHNIIIFVNKKNKNKYSWAYKKLKNILDNSVYLVLDLKENVDFSFNDIDEVKTKKFSKKYLENIYQYESNLHDNKMEYWNMHTYSNKVIETSKISLLKSGDSFSANDIIKTLANKNKDFIKDNCKLLNDYLLFLDNN